MLLARASTVKRPESLTLPLALAVLVNNNRLGEVEVETITIKLYALWDHMPHRMKLTLQFAFHNL